jgi:hypothetical protein
VADLVELAIPATVRDRREATLLGWPKALPDELLRQRPVLSNEYAGMLLQTGGEVEAAAARAGAAGDGAGGGRSGVAGLCALVRALRLSPTTGGGRQQRRGEQALEELHYAVRVRHVACDLGQGDHDEVGRARTRVLPSSPAEAPRGRIPLRRRSMRRSRKSAFTG